jgi:hypothetical protein
MIHKEFRIPLILQALFFLIPLNIYIIGDWMGSGIQTLFFRYNQTNIGNSLIFLNREIYFLTSGLVTGKSAFASVFWLIGVVLICIATILVIYAYFREKPEFIRYCAWFNIGGALLFTLSILIQYGLTLNGPSGIAIPFGIPVILGVAYFQYRSAADELAEDEDEGEDEEYEEDDDGDSEEHPPAAESPDPKEPETEISR